MDRRRRADAAWSAARIAAAVAIAAAVIVQGITTIGAAAGDGRHVATVAANYFSFFTILSNIAASVVLAWSGISHLSRRRTDAPHPAALEVAFVCVTPYLLITGARSEEHTSELQSL